MGSHPRFMGHLQNVTVSLGREATFTCTVKQLGGHRVSRHIRNQILYPSLCFRNCLLFYLIRLNIKHFIIFENRLRG